MSQSSGRLATYPFSLRILAILLVWLMAFAPSYAQTSTAQRSTTTDWTADPGRNANAPWTTAPEVSVGPSQAQRILQAATAGQVLQRNHEADEWGEITVAQPKIWQYERVNALLDGLLRDIEGVSVADLTQLDPNKTNGAALKFVQSLLEIGVKYDQAAGVTNGILQKNYQTMQGIGNGQVQANSAYLQQLYSARQSTAAQLLIAQKQSSDLQAKLAAATQGSTEYTNLQTQLTTSTTEVTNLQKQLDTINTQITSASTAPAALNPPNVTNTSAGTPPESPTEFTDFLGKLPPDLIKGIISQMQTPTYPATKQLDNFMTLLYERLAREISALQDDLIRDPDNVAFLVQFDVGLYPAKQSKNHVGVAEFSLNCDECKVYSIYPGQSSYNIANFEGASKRYQFWGNVLTLIGLGISADYRRQEDTLHGDLTQSVYMSGFQEGAAGPNRSSQPSKQRFGWYYGEAPFENFVTPGIRSTFAIITVPRTTLEQCSIAVKMPTDAKCPTGIVKGATPNALPRLQIDAHTDWVRRDNPYYRQAHSYDSPTYVGTHNYPAPNRELLLPLPGTQDLEEISPVIQAERNQLHALSMEYNTIYYDKLKTTDSGSASSTGAPANSASTASPPQATLQTLPPPDPLTACPKNYCAGVLIRLDQPIDPNLVVTVRGQPLRRVRDWRGRATSILPPAQSASDTTPGTTGGQGLQRTENPGSRSLLEADQLAANTWYAVDSHRLLLNISRDLVPDQEFPVIQIADPAKRTLVVPYSLDEGFTELVINGFHMAPRGQPQLEKYVNVHFAVNWNRSRNGSFTLRQDEILHPSGPYAFETYLPLFLPKRDDAPIYAYLGETGSQLLITFLVNPLGSPSNKLTVEHSWLDSRIQVVLEDRDLDLAWSLSCYSQGPYLVCDVPQQAIAVAYLTIKNLCEGSSPTTTNCPALSNHWGDFPFVSSLQVWVEQYDPDGQNSFYSATPASFGLFPVQACKPESGSIGEISASECALGLTGPNASFSPWHFFSSKVDSVWLEGCGYYPIFKESSIVDILGTHIPTEFRKNGQKAQLANSPNTGCLKFPIPTVALTHQELVIRNQDSPSPTPLPLTTALFAPNFSKPEVEATRIGSKIDGWNIRIPASHVDCHDSIEITPSLKGKLKWAIGNDELGEVSQQDSCVVVGANKTYTDANWQEASRTGNIMLKIRVERSDLVGLPEDDIYLLRDGMRIGKLPNLRDLILPRKLAIGLTGKNQISMLGKHAGVIDAVSIQGPGGPYDPQKVAGTTDMTLATIPVAAPAKTGGATAGKSTQAIPSGPMITQLSALQGKVDDPIVIEGTGFGPKPGTVTFGGTPAEIIPTNWHPDSITVLVPKNARNGVIIVSVPSMPSSNSVRFVVAGDNQSPTGMNGPRIDSTNKSDGAEGDEITIEGENFGTDKGKVTIGGMDATVSSWDVNEITAKIPTGASNKGVFVTVGTGPSKILSNRLSFTVSPPKQTTPAPAAGTYTVLPLICVDKCGETNPQYMPIDVTDKDGNPLTFTVPEPPKAATTDNNGGQTTTTTITKNVKVTGTPQTTTGGAAGTTATTPAKKPNQ